MGSGLMPPDSPTIAWLVAVAVSLVAAGFDVRCRRVPNLLTGPALLAGLVYGGWSGGWAGLGDSAAGMLLMAAPFLALFALAGGGAGDAKLMAALGAWLGVTAGVIALGAVCVATIVGGAAFALVKRRLRHLFGRLRQMACPTGLYPGRTFRHDKPTRAEAPLTMPFAAVIFVGVSLAAAGMWVWQLNG